MSRVKRRRNAACLGACCLFLLAVATDANRPDGTRPPAPPPPPPRTGPRPPPPRPDSIIQSQEDEKTRQLDPREAGIIRPPPRRQSPPRLLDAAQQKRSLMQVHQQAQQLMQTRQEAQPQLHRPPPRLHQPPPKQQQQQQQQQRPLPQQQRPLLQQQLPPQQRPPQQRPPQYQHTRPLQPLPQHRPPSASQGTLKSLWQRVERGLDGLADLEDAVAGRAKSLFKQDTVTFEAIMPPPVSSTQTEKEDGHRPVETQKEESDEESSDDEQEKGTRVDLYKMYTGQKPAAVPDKKLIGANGGASTPMQPVRPPEKSTPPNGSTGEGPYSRLVTRDAVERQQGEIGAGPKDGRDMSGLNSRIPPQNLPREVNPYVGNGQKRPQERPVAPKRSNPISEFNARPTGQRPPSRPARPFVDDEPSSVFTKFVSILPRLPHLPSFSRLIGRGSGSYKVYADSTLDAWKKDDEESGRKQPVWSRMFRRGSGAIPSVITTISREAKPSYSTTPPIAELLARSKHGNSTCLLSDQDVRKSQSIGMSRAVMDVACLAFLLLGVREALPFAVKVPVPHSFSDLFEVALPELRQALGSSFGTWAPFALVAAFLALKTNTLIYDSSIRSVASSIGTVVQSATEYSQLYLRLIASLSVDKHIPNRMYRAASSQFVGVAAAARLSSFVLIVLVVVVIMSVSMVRPVVVGILVALTQMVTLEQWRHWPLPLSEIGISVKNIILPLGDQVRDLVAGEFSKVMDDPLKLVFTCSVFLAALAMTALPMIEQRRAVPLVLAIDGEDEGEAAAYAFGSTESISKLGSSSASRLGLLAESGAPEAIMERWRAMLPETNPEHRSPPMQSTLRLVGYGALTTIVASLPLVLHHILGMSSDLTTQGPIHVHSVVDSSVLLAFAVFLTWNAMGHLIVASDARPSAVGFLKSLRGTVEEFAHSQQSSQMPLQFHAAVSPTKGLTVTDLWAAHTAKRAWAVRGAHFSCRNGEVVVILGDDGAGKSRLLTAISEAIVVPPCRSVSTTRVRGSITFGGVDVTKWDRGQIKKRLGLVLNDVRSVSATADLFSGLTLEEILEPLDGVHQPGEPHILSTQEKNAMGAALQITGLSTTLLPRLPSKLSTVVTANEDELIPSPLRPRSNALSPAEWSKLLLSRVLTQAILDNDNPASSGQLVEKSLIGSLLLLDDVMVHMSEAEEATLIATLRRTGAASVVTSHKWATGRFADRIVVVKDGAIVENGTHNELLARGPQQSIYAAKWHAMTTL